MQTQTKPRKPETLIKESLKETVNDLQGLTENSESKPIEIKPVNRYKKASLSDIKHRELLGHTYQWVHSLQGLPAPLVIGNVGSGKTYYLYALLHKLQSVINTDLKITPMTQLITEIKDSISNNMTTEKIHETRKQPVLLLDDLGSERITDFTQEIFYVVIDYRWTYQLPTAITSNYSVAELQERLGERIVSRILGLCKPFILKGEDRRL